MTDDNDQSSFLTVVYRDIQPGNEARVLVTDPRVSASAWSHAIHDRAEAAEMLAAARRQPAGADATQALRWLAERDAARAERDSLAVLLRELQHAAAPAAYGNAPRRASGC
jgi:hypothetical protein